MRSRMGMVATCLTAIAMVPAISSGVASAASPEYRVCAKVKSGGAFNDKNCAVSSKGGRREGKYELAPWTAAKKTRFKGSFGAFLVTAFVHGVGSEGTYECVKGKFTGAITGPKETAQSLRLEKCTSSGKVFTSPGAPVGDIDWSFTGVLKASSESATGVAEEIQGSGPGEVGGPGHVFGEANEEGDEFTYSGALSGEATGDIGVISKTRSIEYEKDAGGEPTVGSTEPFLQTLVGVGSFESGVEATAAVKGEAFGIY